jgi:hypothetical protein
MRTVAAAFWIGLWLLCLGCACVHFWGTSSVMASLRLLGIAYFLCIFITVLPFKMQLL